MCRSVYGYLSCEGKVNAHCYRRAEVSDLTISLINRCGRILRPLILALCIATRLSEVEAHQVGILRGDQQKAQLVVDGTPTALFFARQLSSPDELEAYKEAGFNTVWVDVSYGPNTLLQLSEAERLLEAAKDEGLFAVVCIDARPPAGIRMSVYDWRYISFAQSWLRQVVKQLGKHTNIVAWATTNFPDERAAESGGYDDEGFRAFLAHTYGDLKALSHAFGVPIADLRALNQKLAMTIDDLQSPTQYGHSSLSGAIYRWCSLKWLMWFWGKVIRDSDAHRPILTGLLSTYRGISSVPSIYDGIVTATFPYACEPELQSHNVHSVSIGRCGNAFLVIPVIASQLGAKTISLQQLIRWIQLAALNGACGIGFNSWQPFKSDERLRKVLSELLRQLTEAGIWHATPFTHAAILYIPFAEGFVQDGMPLYGYATPHGYVNAQPQRLILGEPNGLLNAFKLGTRYGQLDCLSIESLWRINPSRYSLILMPAPLFISPHVVDQTGVVHYNLGMPTPPDHLSEMGLKEEPLKLFPKWLTNFVASGGVLVSDIGASLSPAGEPFRLMPQDFAMLFGVVGARMLIVEPNLALGMSILFRHPLFPSLHEGYILGEDEMPFRTIAAVLRFMGAQPYALMMRHARRTRRITSEAVAMCINRFGRGFAIYAPTLLWANWNTASKSFEAFHGDLLSREAKVELLSSPSLVNDELKVALFDRGVALVNLSGETQLASIRVDAALFGAGALTNACTEFPIGVQSRHIVIHKFVQPLEMAFVKRLPIAVDCEGRFVAVIQRYDSKRIELTLYGSDAVIKVKNGRLAIGAIQPAKFSVTVSSGEYEVAPHSKHAVSISVASTSRYDIQDERSEAIVQADVNGRLRLKANGTVVRIEVRREG
ncbi:MAG: hypothetical protein RMK18_05135 [Armatimonadota bacterium]|nr:hypothetical protein [Armatimonadota bacterium]MDW8025235.1 hypothetical protein [Armatimonadota bacterium]